MKNIRQIITNILALSKEKKNEFYKYFLKLDKSIEKIDSKIDKCVTTDETDYTYEQQNQIRRNLGLYNSYIDSTPVSLNCDLGGFIDTIFYNEYQQYRKITDEIITPDRLIGQEVKWYNDGFQSVTGTVTKCTPQTGNNVTYYRIIASSSNTSNKTIGLIILENFVPIAELNNKNFTPGIWILYTKGSGDYDFEYFGAYKLNYLPEVSSKIEDKYLPDEALNVFLVKFTGNAITPTADKTAREILGISNDFVQNKIAIVGTFNGSTYNFINSYYKPCFVGIYRTGDRAYIHKIFVDANSDYNGVLIPCDNKIFFGTSRESDISIGSEIYNLVTPGSSGWTLNSGKLGLGLMGFDNINYDNVEWSVDKISGETTFSIRNCQSQYAESEKQLDFDFSNLTQSEIAQAVVTAKWEYSYQQYIYIRATVYVDVTYAPNA